MSVSIGPYDPIILIFSLINTLMKKEYLSYSEAREIIKQSLPSNMTDDEKEKLLDSLLKKTNKSIKK
jgi:hypothetical protein